METTEIQMKTDIYDGLLKLGVREPAVFKMGDRHIIGAWEEMNVLEKRNEEWYVLKSGKKAVRVYGDAASWKDAINQAGQYLRGTDLSGSKTSDTFPSQSSAEPVVFGTAISY